MSDKLRAVLILAKKYIGAANHEAEANHDDMDGELYMDGVQYEIMQETTSLMQDIDALLVEIGHSGG